MKPFIVLARVILVGCFWSVFFFEGIRVIMLRNWRFDIVNSEHWDFAWTLWINGWIISDAKEWAFVIIIITFIPLLLTGWAALSLINVEDIVMKLLSYPINLIKILLNKHFNLFLKIKNATSPIKQKISYKEVRPRGIGGASIAGSTGISAPSMPSSSPWVKKNRKNAPISASKPSMSGERQEKSSIFEHSIFKDEKDEDFSFNFDIFDIDNKKEVVTEKEEKKPIPVPAKDFENKKRNRDEEPSSNYKDSKKIRPINEDREKIEEKSSKAKEFREKLPRNEDNKQKVIKENIDIPKKPTYKNDENVSFEPKIEQNKKKEINSGVPEIIKEKGYRIFTSTIIKNTLIDFIGVSKNKISLYLIDREPGDWLADEEDFNGEEPLWFSESSHRVSPVRMLESSVKYLRKELAKKKIATPIDAYLIIQLGNIINAEDMINIWNSKDIIVTRIDRGSPKDIILFNKALKEVESISYAEFDKMRTIIRELK